jgi:hypothetical protein
VSPPRIIGTLPGAGFVIEQVTADGTRSVLPLAGWGVTAEGAVLPLPLSLGDNWQVRPEVSEDGRLIRTTSIRAQRPQTRHSSVDLDPSSDIWRTARQYEDTVTAR